MAGFELPFNRSAAAYLEFQLDGVNNGSAPPLNANLAILFRSTAGVRFRF